MESIWAILELLLISAVVLAFGLSAAIVFETFRRRFNHTHVEAPPVFEDPTSFKPVPCPHIFDPAEKYTYPWSYLHTMKNTGLLEPLKKL
ncbi:hypothetical protein RDI58_014079 [Solanum bulbocastanum]|uniref:Uncharacterized protein n=1 Tax=Solanum bulbocastanum TaxID=147425 RepID=A0AAN8TNY4_SOLBU